MTAQRPGLNLIVRWRRIDRCGAPVGILGVGGAAATPPASPVGGRPRGIVVDVYRDSFRFLATSAPAGDLWRAHRALMAEDYALALDVHVSMRHENLVRLTATRNVYGYIERLFHMHVLGKAEAYLEGIEPPGVWARQLPVLRFEPTSALGLQACSP